MGSVETLEWAAHPDRKYVYLHAYSPVESVARYLPISYRELAQRRYGYEASSDRIGWSTPIYVAETDEQAVNEAREHIEALFKRVPAEAIRADVLSRRATCRRNRSSARSPPSAGTAAASRSSS